MHSIGTGFSCGDYPLVSIDLLGKMVYTCRDWYTLCAYCSNVMTVQQGAWYHKHPCCQHCLPVDKKITTNKQSTSYTFNQEKSSNTNGEINNVACRLCHTTQFLTGPIHSPLDDSTYNYDKQPQDRYTHWCKEHCVDGLEEMLQTKTTCHRMAYILMK